MEAASISPIRSLWRTEGGAQIERISGISPREFQREYVNKNRPAILTDVISEWPALRKWTPRFFAEMYGERPIDFIRGPVKQMKMADFIDQVEASRPGAPAPYWTNNPLMNLFPELLRDISPFPKHTTPNWATRSYLHRGMQQSLNRGATVELYMGGAGGAFPILHWDGQSTHAFLMQIHGRKQYWAWAPDQSDFLYPVEGFVNLSKLGDVEHPDFESYPLFRKAKGCQFHLDPGEMLFVPSRWWHTAKMTGPAITLSINTVNRSNWRGFSEDMTRKARRPAVYLKKAYLSAAWMGNEIADLVHGFLPW